MIGFLSDVGKVRNLNEDFLCYHECEDFCVYVVADGMGGHNAGEVASKMAAEGIVEYIKGNFYSEGSSDILKRAIEKVNNDIYIHSIREEKLSGMGTTVTAALVVNNKVIIANVGDSSCMGIKDDNIIKITKDHSLVQELVDLGTITEVEAANHPRKNIITRAVGTSDFVDVDIFVIDEEKYDIYLLCSDGLTNELTKEEIVSIIKDEMNPVTICNKLVSSAKIKGGRDNITVLLFGGER